MTTAIALNEIRTNTSHTNTKMTIKNLRTGWNIAHNYTCLKLIYKEVNIIFGKPMGVAHLMLGQLCLFCNFVVIKEWATSKVTLLVIGIFL